MAFSLTEVQAEYVLIPTALTGPSRRNENSLPGRTGWLKQGNAGRIDGLHLKAAPPDQTEIQQDAEDYGDDRRSPIVERQEAQA